nr:multiple cyclophane-containing RiPP AmcA [Verrucosispora sioxanthis]
MGPKAVHTWLSSAPSWVAAASASKADRLWRQTLTTEGHMPQTTRPADPPLLTHAWRQLFERQVREAGRR